MQTRFHNSSIAPGAETNQRPARALRNLARTILDAVARFIVREGARPWILSRPPALSLAALCLCCFAPQAFAKLPEPDAIFYGFITIDGQRVTAAQTDVVVEARRSSSGTVVASYRLGSDPASGDAYVLRVPLEAISPLLNPLASALGETLRLEVRSLAGRLAEREETISDRGQLRRLDFQIGDPGADTNGLPDAWELEYFGIAGQDPGADPDGDGQTNREEYEAGSDPAAADDVFVLSVASDGDLPQVSFLARRAAGAGYEGRTRYYTLESTTDLGAGQWIEVPGFTEVPGDDRLVTWTGSSTVERTFFRARARLAGP